MKTRNLFKIIAVLSPMVLAATFSVSALATPVTTLEPTTPKEKVELLERVNPAVNLKTRVEVTQINPDGTSFKIPLRENLEKDRRLLQAQMDAESNAEIKASNQLMLDESAKSLARESFIADLPKIKPDMSFSQMLLPQSFVEVDGREIANTALPVPTNSSISGRDVSNDGAIDEVSSSDEIEEVQEDLSTLADEVIATTVPTDIDENTEEMTSSSSEEEFVTSSSMESGVEEFSESSSETLTAVVVQEVAAQEVEVITQPVSEIINVTDNESSLELSIESEAQIAKTESIEEAATSEIKLSTDGVNLDGETTGTDGVITQVQAEEIEGPQPAAEAEVVEAEVVEAEESEVVAAMESAADALIQELPIDSVETVATLSSSIVSEVASSEDLSEEEVTETLVNIESAEATANEIALELQSTEVTAKDSEVKTELQEKLEKVLAELEEAKKSLQEKDKMLAEQKQEHEEVMEAQVSKFEDLEEAQENLNKAYCEREDQFAALTAKVEELQNNNVNKIQETMMAMMMPMYMNMIANQGPRVNNGFDGDFAQKFFGQRNRGQDYGLQMLSLADLFNGRSMGGVNYNVYNIGGDYVGGNFQSNPVSGGVTNAQQFRYNQNPALQFGQQLTGAQDPMRPFSFRFDNGGTLDSSRFDQLNNQSSFAHRNQIESNLRMMNEGRNVFERIPSGQQQSVVPNINGQMST